MEALYENCSCNSFNLKFKHRHANESIFKMNPEYKIALKSERYNVAFLWKYGMFQHHVKWTPLQISDNSTWLDAAHCLLLVDLPMQFGFLHAVIQSN